MDIEKKALELLNAVRAERGLGPLILWQTRYGPGEPLPELGEHAPYYTALCRAIEAHEADNARHAAEMEAFRREVSEAAYKAIHAAGDGARLGALEAYRLVRTILSPFIIRKPVHPLVQAAADIDLFWNADMGTD